MSRLYYHSLLVLAFCILPSALFAQRYDVSHLGGVVNTVGSETGAVVIDDSVLLYSSHGIGNKDLMQFRLASVDTLGRVTQGRPCTWPVNNKRTHTGNAAYDARNGRLFYTQCEADDTGAIQCAIWMAQRRNGRWQRGHRLGGDVNLAGYTNTHPTVAYQPDGGTLLFFVSDRPGGMGGLDIWYTVVRDDAVGHCANLGNLVNSASDELTPYYDTLHNVLYFSSDRPGGLGGYDIYRAEGTRDAWRRPAALPAPLNSCYNDLYFTIGTACGCWGFLSSNREDSMFETDSSCCNDLYRWRLLPEEKVKPTPPTLEPLNPFLIQTVSPLAAPESNSQPSTLNAQFSISLFFHNDQPDAGSWSDTTAVSYFQTYNRYMFLRGEYLAASDSVSRQQIADFFDEVRHNCDRFEQLMEYMRDDLEAGRTVEVTLQGYASTPHTGLYNMHLSARRIACVVNQLRVWKGGVLSRYLDEGRLQVRVLPFGSQRAASVEGRVDPVFSVEMARERRVEIVGYQCR